MSKQQYNAVISKIQAFCLFKLTEGMRLYFFSVRFKVHEGITQYLDLFDILVKQMKCC